MNKLKFQISFIAMVVYLFGVVPNVKASVEVQWPNFERELEQLGLSIEFGPQSMARLQTYIYSQIENLEKQASNSDDKQIEALNEHANIYRLLLQFIEKGQGSDTEKYTYALRALYSIKSEFGTSRKMHIWENLRIINYFSTRIGYVKLSERNLALGKKLAELEAANLYPSAQAIAPITKQQMAAMSTVQLADLDVSANHPSAYRYEVLSSMADPFQHMEKIQNKIVNQALQGQGTASVYQLEQSYFLQFFSKMESRATSPKIYSKDSFGQKWKVKLGNEIQSESIVNRLAARIGQKYFDLSYTSSGPSKKIMMIFKPANQEQDAKYDKYLGLKKKQILGTHGKKAQALLNELCLEVSSVEQFKTCFKDLTYHFDVTKFILGRGLITKDNLMIVQPFLAPGASLQELQDKLIGREYVIFRESNAEFGGGSWERLGAVAMGQLGAEDDRYWRATGVFQMLLWDTDAKEDNARGVITEDAKYFENPHDLASALGSPLEVGNFNKLKLGEDFAKISADAEAIKIRGFVAFRPKAWSKTTFADGLWMAKRLALLTPKVLNQVFSQTHLPQFVREVGVYRLGMRIKQLLDLYGVNSQAFSNLSPPSINVMLNVDLMKSLGVTQSEWDIYLRQNRIPHNFSELVVRDGVMAKCHDSHLVNLLEQTAHPSGISRRLVRFFDGRPLSGCKVR